MPRVPMQGLSNVVPPQDPNHVPFPNIGNTLANIDFGKKLLQILGERKVMNWISKPYLEVSYADTVQCGHFL